MNDRVKLGVVVFGVGLAILSVITFGVPHTSNASKTATTPYASAIEVPPLAKDAARNELVKYVETLQVKFITWEIMRQTYLSKLQQDIQWGALDKFREDAETFKETAQRVQQDIFTIPRETNLTEEDSSVIDAVASAADELATADVMLAVDIVVYAKTGLDGQAETKKDIADAAKARKSFERAVMSAYKHFGYAPTQIDRATLQPVTRK